MLGVLKTVLFHPSSSLMLGRWGDWISQVRLSRPPKKKNKRFLVSLPCQPSGSRSDQHQILISPLSFTFARLFGMMLSRLPALVMRKESRQFPALLRRTYISVDDMIFGEPTIHGNQANSTAQSKLLAPYPVSKKINGKFVGPWPNTRKGLWDVLGLLFGKKRPQLNFSKAVNQLELLQPIPVDRQKMRSVASPHFSWFGHASCYYQSDDIFFLTDPVWSDRASPITIAGPKRFVKPPIELEDLKIDVVLLSHTHYDHLDAASAKRIGNRAHW